MVGNHCMFWWVSGKVHLPTIFCFSGQIEAYKFIIERLS